MARKTQSIGELATRVLETVEQEQLVKSASLSYTRDTGVSTELGKLMVKVAEKIRSEATRPGITYADLHNFRKHYGL